MKNKGYTIIEAVIAMFLVVVMVGAVFSALMSGRRAIVSSSEKEEVLYSVQSAYMMLKDCRNNPNCHLKTLPNCKVDFGGNTQDLRSCDDLFTFNFKNLCKKYTPENDSVHFNYKAYLSSAQPNAWISNTTECGSRPNTLPESGFDILEMNIDCTD